MLPTWKVSFYHLLIEFGFLLQLASVPIEINGERKSQMVQTVAVLWQ